MARARQILLIFAGLIALVLVGSLSDTRIAPVDLRRGGLLRLPASTKGSARIDVLAADQAGAPIAGAVVHALSLRDERAYTAGTARTDPFGSAPIGALPAGETWVVAEAENHARASTHLVLAEGAREIRLTLGPEQLLQVTVVDDSGAPVAEASLEVQTGDPLPLAGQTDSKGEGTVGRLAAPPWDVRISAPGFQATAETVKQVSATPLRVILRRLGAFDVTTVDADGRPVAGAIVMVAGSGLWPARKVTTDDSGDARIVDLSRGFYDLRAVHGDLVSLVEFGVPLGRGEMKSVKLALRQGRRVAIHVTDGEAPDAKPVAGASLVAAEGGLSSFPLETTTDASGDGSLGPIAPGDAYISARASGFVAKSGVPVPDAAVSAVRIALVRGGVLVGQVLDTRGFPVAGATIEVVGFSASGDPIVESSERTAFRAAHFSSSLGGPPLVLRGGGVSAEAPGGAGMFGAMGGVEPARGDPRDVTPAGELGVMRGPVPPIPRGPVPTASIFNEPPPALAPRVSAEPLPEPWTSGESGGFRASPIPPGSVRAIVRHPAYVEAASELVTIPPAGEARVQVVLHRGATLEGRLLDDRRVAVAATHVELVAARGSFARGTFTARDGSFAFASVPADVVISVSLPTDVGEVALRMPVALEEGGRKEVELILPVPRESSAVRVLTDRGQPVQGAEVVVTSLAPELPLHRTSFTDRDGQVTFAHAAGLPVRLSIARRGHAPKTLDLASMPADLPVELAEGVAVTGTITTARGHAALEGAEITLYAGGQSIRARTDRDGVFALDDVPPGEARLVAAHKGYVKGEQSVTIEAPVRAGRPVSLDPLDLEPGGIVEGEVVDAQGAAVGGARVAIGSLPPAASEDRLPDGVVVTNARGEFRLEDVADGEVALEAAVPDRGRGHAEGVRIAAGQTTTGVRIVLASE